MGVASFISQPIAEVAKLHTISQYDSYNVTYKLNIVLPPNIIFEFRDVNAFAEAPSNG